MTKKDTSRRDRKKQETRQRLMTVALRLFRKHGYDATSVEQITEAADVAKGTFFNYFEAKEAILPALVEWRLQELKESLAPEQGAPASPVARIKLALRLVVEDPLADHALVRQLFALPAQHKRPSDGHHPGRALTDLLTEQVHQAQAAGEIRADLEPSLIGRVFLTISFQQVMMWHHSGHSPSLSKLLDQAIDMLLDGVAGPNWKHIEEG